jgi:hypothetical protein
VSAETRELLDREAARIYDETGGKPSGGKIVDRIVKERLGRPHSD